MFYKGQVETDVLLLRKPTFVEVKLTSENGLFLEIMLTLVEIFEGNIPFNIVYSVELMYQDLPLRILQQNHTIIFLNAILAWQFNHSL